MSLDLIRGLYDYHAWANRRLFDVAVERGEAAVTRDMGPQWSWPTILKMFAHIYGADAIWLGRWKSAAPSSFPGNDLPSMAALRTAWDAFEVQQRAYLDALTEADLARVLDYKNLQGVPQRAPMWQLLQHVPNHATHHRSEINTMLTLISGSPPDTGINSFILAKATKA
ncbi:MAG: hypothetical protein FJZ38_14280 [Candidatus Rokubacteria bacterium]|nr:hypothetical protein [Candidatus Rokubacteria bacterium]